MKFSFWDICIFTGVLGIAIMYALGVGEGVEQDYFKSVVILLLYLINFNLQNLYSQSERRSKDGHK